MYAKFIVLLASCRNLELLVSLPGGDSVRGFFMVTLLVELAAVPALRVKIYSKIREFMQYVLELLTENYKNHL